MSTPSGRASSTTLEREWGRLWRGQLSHLLRASEQRDESPLAIELLRAVVESGELRASDLAQQLFVTKTSISRYVNEMLERGLLSQRRDPNDGRAVLLSVTAAGRRLWQRREARRSSALAELCAGWSEGEVATFTSLLRRLNDRQRLRQLERQANATALRTTP